MKPSLLFQIITQYVNHTLRPTSDCCMFPPCLQTPCLQTFVSFGKEQAGALLRAQSKHWAGLAQVPCAGPGVWQTRCKGEHRLVSLHCVLGPSNTQVRLVELGWHRCWKGGGRLEGGERQNGLSGHRGRTGTWGNWPREGGCQNPGLGQNPNPRSGRPRPNPGCSDLPADFSSANLSSPIQAAAVLPRVIDSHCPGLHYSLPQLHAG